MPDPSDVVPIVKGLLTALLLPPLALVLTGLGGAVLAWRGWRPGALLAIFAAAALLFLATPLGAGLLIASLEREAEKETASAKAASAIVVLGAEVAHSRQGPEVGPFTLERLRTGAALHRATGLPLLVTGGPLTPGEPPLAVLMARSLVADFGIVATWVEPEARDTRENATHSAALLDAAGIGVVLLVTHAWHMPRARAAFAQNGILAIAAPVRINWVPNGSITDWLPRADHLGWSWWALREWAGRLAYALRG